jgi:hypothetical protein
MVRRQGFVIEVVLYVVGDEGEVTPIHGVFQRVLAHCRLGRLSDYDTDVTLADLRSL